MQTSIPGPELAPAAAQLLDVLRTTPSRLRMNELATATGLSVASVGTSLRVLERRGQARYASGCWTITDRARAL